MKIKVSISLTSWIRMQQKMYGKNLWFIRTPEGRMGFSKKPFDLAYLYAKYWNPALEDYKGNHYENLDAQEYPVGAVVNNKMPIAFGTQMTAEELIQAIQRLEEES